MKHEHLIFSSTARQRTSHTHTHILFKFMASIIFFFLFSSYAKRADARSATCVENVYATNTYVLYILYICVRTAAAAAVAAAEIKIKQCIYGKFLICMLRVCYIYICV